MQAPIRQSVDLSAYPDLVVILLGFKVRAWRGIGALIGIGPKLGAIQTDRPEGLLAHENFLFSIGHVGIRQYWRDVESLERFTRSAPHADWWRDLSKLSRGAGFWHETYARSGAMEALYVNMPPTGLARFAPSLEPVGPLMSARSRMERTYRPAPSSI